MANCSDKISIYETWYDFKKDLAQKLGHMPLNWEWLQVKPKAPLPWDDSHMYEALAAAGRLERQRRAKEVRNKRLSGGPGSSNR